MPFFCKRAKISLKKHQVNPKISLWFVSRPNKVNLLSFSTNNCDDPAKQSTHREAHYKEENRGVLVVTALRRENKNLL
ncbi:hypothetical protein HanIR_Chr06g0265701 [Helianthus annuus]|nr:hypothetical protein HanIR_Chr06g0265701 [Helianthus annuus]